MVQPCCNPFNHSKSFRHSKSRRPVKQWMILKNPNLSTEDCICDNCRRSMMKRDYTSDEKSYQDLNESTPENSDSDEQTTVSECDITSPVNKILKLSKSSPLKPKKFKSTAYRNKKVHEIKRALFKGETNECIDSKIIQACKEKFEISATKCEKIQLLTIAAAAELSINETKEIFKCSKRMIISARKLFKEKGILASPEQRKQSNQTSTETIEKVKQFYEEDEVSRVMPGKKDCIIIRNKITGIKEYKQKRLLLNTISELYELWKEKYGKEGNLKIGKSKFAELRPAHCVLPGTPGTHNICVCAIHENTKLMYQDCNLSNLTSNTSSPLNTIEDCLAALVCDLKNPKCIFGECTTCPGTEPLQERLHKIFEDNYIDEVRYRQWVNVDRCNIETLVTSSEQFIDNFCSKLELLLVHSFVAKQQAHYLNELKSNLTENEAVAIMDFSQNYSIKIQDCIQGYYWSNLQSTLHVSCIYYMENGTLTNINHLAISESLTHDASAVSLFQSRMIPQIKAKLPHIKKIHYFTDGAGSQYKNRKSFVNLAYHEEDYGIIADWNFFATSHGKGKYNFVPPPPKKR